MPSKPKTSGKYSRGRPQGQRSCGATRNKRKGQAKGAQKGSRKAHHRPANGLTGRGVGRGQRTAQKGKGHQRKDSSMTLLWRLQAKAASPGKGDGELLRILWEHSTRLTHNRSSSAQMGAIVAGWKLHMARTESIYVNFTSAM